MTFEECLKKCAETDELVKEFDRLNNTHLSTLSQRTPLDRMIDEATGRDREAVQKFAGFVTEFIWLPMITSQCR